MKKRRFSAVHLLAAVLLAVALTLAGGVLTLRVILGAEGLGMMEAMLLIKTKFVGEHDIGAATDQAMDALIDGLGDRWSYYMDADAYAAQQESRSNSYVGIGVTVTYPEEGGLLIQSVTEGGPAAAAGLVPGERITAVDGTPLTAENQQEAAAMVRGP